VANAPPATRDELRADLLLAMQEAATAGNLSRAKSRNNMWGIWCAFCTANNLDDMLATVEDPVPILQAFARRYRDGRLAALHNPVRARTVEDVIRGIGRTFVELGTENPRLNVYGNVDPRLSAQIAQWKQEDPPPSRVKPIPISVLHHVYTAAQASGMIERITLADMIYIAFFYLNSPGEYTAAAEGSRPFRYCDAALFIG